MNNSAFLSLVLIFFVFLASCHNRSGSEYERLAKAELAKNIRVDSIYFGIHFGMSKNEFFDHCWKLNREGVLSSGTSSLSVHYKLDTGLRHQADMNFIPGMVNDTIYEMTTIFNYSGFVPTNKSLLADSLIVDVQQMLERWYGKGFITIKDEKKGIAKVKIDGNRRIGVYKADDYNVIALFTDLSKPEILKTVKNEESNE